MHNLRARIISPLGFVLGVRSGLQSHPLFISFSLCLRESLHRLPFPTADSSPMMAPLHFFAVLFVLSCCVGFSQSGYIAYVKWSRPGCSVNRNNTIEKASLFPLDACTHGVIRTCNSSSEFVTICNCTNSTDCYRTLSSREQKNAPIRLTFSRARVRRRVHWSSILLRKQ